MFAARSSPVSAPPERASTPARLLRLDGAAASESEDRVVTEEPLEIRLRAGEERSTVAVTMRTPGADRELAVGFLYAEGVVQRREQVRAVRELDDPWGEPGKPSNVLEVELALSELPDIARLERHFFASSACGVCGKAGIENLRLRGHRRLEGGPTVPAELLYALPDRLRQAQGVFDATGGLHAAALFDAEGALLAVREDVGRHNALDKLVGWAFAEGRLPLSGGIVLVSGRSSFEIVQKCVAAGVPILCSVSAPSSLAVELASELGLTLVGFLRGRRLNLYAGRERIVLPR
jgi:FdhD protein